jgi:hypothetical protein
MIMLMPAQASAAASGLTVTAEAYKTEGGLGRSCSTRIALLRPRHRTRRDPNFLLLLLIYSAFGFAYQTLSHDSCTDAVTLTPCCAQNPAIGVAWKHTLSSTRGYPVGTC